MSMVDLISGAGHVTSAKHGGGMYPCGGCMSAGLCVKHGRAIGGRKHLRLCSWPISPSSGRLRKAMAVRAKAGHFALHHHRSEPGLDQGGRECARQ